MKRFISVVIANYNGSKTIASCLESILNSNYNDFEVIVVDDCSTDNSVQIIRGFNCKLIELEENEGPAYARNVGAKASNGDIILFTDSDVCVKDDTLKLINETFERKPNISSVVGLPDKNCKFRNVSSKYFNLRIYFNHINLPDYIPILYGTISAVKRDAFFDVNGFDVHFKTAGVEDNDLGYRLSAKNYKIYSNKTIQVNHYKYISFFGLMRNDILRSMDRVKIMLRKRFVKKIITEKRFISTPMAQIVSALIIPFLVFSFFGLFFNLFSAVVIALLLLLFLKLNFDYLVFVYNEEGVLTSLQFYFLMLIDMFCVNIGLFLGIISYIMGEEY